MKWFDLTKEERKVLDDQDKLEALKRRKLLLDEIRKEYKELKNTNNN